jgi:hypothetical protein
MNLRVVDTEFQFDRRKLTIFFEADDFVQFHHFVRDIYKAYKTRIWLEQVGGTGSLTRPKDGPNDWDAQKGGARAQHEPRNSIDGCSESGHSGAILHHDRILSPVEAAGFSTLNDITNGAHSGTMADGWIHVQENCDAGVKISQTPSSSSGSLQTSNVDQASHQAHYLLPSSLLHEVLQAPRPLVFSSSTSGMSMPSTIIRGSAMSDMPRTSSLWAGMTTQPQFLSAESWSSGTENEVLSSATPTDAPLFPLPTLNIYTSLQGNIAPTPGLQQSPALSTPSHMKELRKNAPKFSEHNYSAVPAVEFICGITGELMNDPVTIADGCSYERAAIIAWLARHRISPTTKRLLPNKGVTSNRSLRTAIDRFRDKRLQERLDHLFFVLRLDE